MNENECVLIKSKDLDALKEPYYVAKKEFDLELKEEIIRNTKERQKLYDTISELNIKIQNNPPAVDAMKLRIIFEDFNRERKYHNNTSPYTGIEAVNFKLDSPLYRQISNILSNFSKMLFDKSVEKAENIKKINVEKLTKEVEKRCYTEVSNMEYFERRNFLRKFKIKKDDRL